MKETTPLAIPEQELQWDTFRATNRVNCAETCVRLTHVPTGIIVEMSEHRFLPKNKEAALIELNKKLHPFAPPNVKPIALPDKIKGNGTQIAPLELPTLTTQQKADFYMAFMAELGEPELMATVEDIQVTHGFKADHVEKAIRQTLENWQP